MFFLCNMGGVFFFFKPAVDLSILQVVWSSGSPRPRAGSGAKPYLEAFVTPAAGRHFSTARVGPNAPVCRTAHAYEP